MLSQHPPAEWINLAERYRLEPARPLQAKVEPANSCEQRKDTQLGHSARNSLCPRLVIGRLPNLRSSPRFRPSDQALLRGPAADALQSLTRL
jgi:hypothetical protein